MLRLHLHLVVGFALRAQARDVCGIVINESKHYSESKPRNPQRFGLSPCSLI